MAIALQVISSDLPQRGQEGLETVVGALHVRSGVVFDSLTVTFVRFDRDRMVASDTYDSELVGVGYNELDPAVVAPLAAADEPGLPWQNLLDGPQRFGIIARRLR